MENEKIIHLFVTGKCHHDCKLCCNKQYNIDDIPVVTVQELKNADTVLITGGEPFLIAELADFTRNIRRQYENIKQLYVYTAGRFLMLWRAVYDGSYRSWGIDGINLSPKDEKDVISIKELLREGSSSRSYFEGLDSSRLYVFPDTDISILEELHLEEIKTLEIIRREWQPEFKAQSGIFRRLPVLLL